MANLEMETIKHALAIAHREGFTELHLELDDSAFTAVLPPASQGAPARADRNGAVVEALPETGPSTRAISATCVGYYRPSDSVLKVGNKVSQGDIVGTITALGLANDVEAPVSGEIVEILAQPEQAVEYGQALAVIKESS